MRIMLSKPKDYRLSQDMNPEEKGHAKSSYGCDLLHQKISTAIYVAHEVQNSRE